MVKELLIFAGGAVVGSASCFFAMRSHFENRMQNEIDDIREEYKKRTVTVVEDEEPVDIPVEQKPEETDVYAYKRTDAAYDYSGNMNESTDGPVVIGIADYIDPEYDEFEKRDLVYYDDGVLVYAETGEIMEDAKRLVGDEWRSRFGDEQTAVVYVRNHEDKMDFEITQSDELYSEVDRE